MTLPLIRALEGVPASTRRQALKHLRRAGERSASVAWLRDFVAQSDGPAYAAGVMGRYHAEAVGLLEAYPESPVRRALTAYADYVVGRAF